MATAEHVGITSQTKTIYKLKFVVAFLTVLGAGFFIHAGVTLEAGYYAITHVVVIDVLVGLCSNFVTIFIVYVITRVTD